MATLIKLTKTNGTTKGGYHWAVGTTHSLPAKDNPQLCSRDVFHAYESAEVAAFLRHIHDYNGDVLAWEAEGDVVVRDATKVGVFSLTVTGEAELPQPTLKQTVLFALFCASAVLPTGAMDEAIEATRREAYVAAAHAANAVVRMAAYAAVRTVEVAEYALYAADYAADAADAAARADAADRAHRAAARVADAARTIDLHAIAVRALAE